MLLGNEEDFSAALGYTLEGVDESHTDLDASAYERLHREVLDGYSNLSLVATSLREAHTATVNDWGGVCSTREAFFAGPRMRGLRSSTASEEATRSPRDSSTGGSAATT